MLSELIISNLAIIEKQTINFASGLNVISGETGSGKSIILEALKLILGGRASGDLIRSGESSLTVEAVINLQNLPNHLINDLPEIARTSDEIVLSRQVASSGKNRVFVNGHLGTVSLLANISGKLINFCGQNQSLRLFQPRYHLELVDNFAGNHELYATYTKVYNEWRSLDDQLKQLRQEHLTKILRRAELETIASELGQVRIEIGRRHILEEKIKALASVEQIEKLTAQLTENLSGQDGESGGALFEVRQAVQLVQQLVGLDSRFLEIRDAIEGIFAGLGEVDLEVGRLLAGIERNDEQLLELRDEIAELARLERKYRCDEQGLLELLSRAQVELETFDDANIAKLEGRVAKLKSQTSELALKLREHRVRVLGELTGLIEVELSELNMADARIKIIREDEELSTYGADRLELLISTNAGEAIKPLREIASGGELSRITLVLKKVLGDKSGVNVLIFDEVDTGISGAVARAVGEKLKSLSSNSQVICVTHLAQVASLADHHILVRKEANGRTTSIARIIEGDERTDEIARLLAGRKVTKASRESAKELMASNI